MAKILAIYYSLTGQTEGVLRAMAEGLEASSHQVDFAAIETIGERYRLPYHKGRFFWEWALAWMGKEIRVEVEPLSLPQPIQSYDLILLGHQPWYLDTSIPMASWLESPEAQALGGMDVVSVITARTLWERAYRRMAQRVEGLGGRLVDSFVARNLSPMPQNMPVTLHYLFEGHDDSPKAVRALGRYGVGESGLKAAKVFGMSLGLRLAQGPLEDSLTHTEANRQDLLRGSARGESERWRRGEGS